MNRRDTGVWWIVVGASLVLAGFANAIANRDSVPPLRGSGLFYEILAFIAVGMGLMIFGLRMLLRARSLPSTVAVPPRA